MVHERANEHPNLNEYMICTTIAINEWFALRAGYLCSIIQFLCGYRRVMDLGAHGVWLASSKKERDNILDGGFCFKNLILSESIENKK